MIWRDDEPPSYYDYDETLCLFCGAKLIDDNPVPYSPQDHGFCDQVCQNNDKRNTHHV